MGGQVTDSNPGRIGVTVLRFYTGGDRECGPDTTGEIGEKRWLLSSTLREDLKKQGGARVKRARGAFLFCKRRLVATGEQGDTSGGRDRI